MNIKKALDREDLGTWLRLAMEVLHAVKKEFETMEDNMKYLQTAGQFVGEVIRPLDKERFLFEVDDVERYLGGCGSEINKTTLTSGTREVVVRCRSNVDTETLTSETRLVHDRATLKITPNLPPEVDPGLYDMVQEDPGNISYLALAGLSDQIQELKDCGVLLYGPPGTGKTLLARAIASNVDAAFLMVVSTAVADKYIGECERLIREMFSYAHDHQLDKVKVIMATNRPDVLDPAFLSPGRLDKKIEIPLPNEHSRLEILKIHDTAMEWRGGIDYEAVAKLSEGLMVPIYEMFVRRLDCLPFVQAGLFALRAGHDYAIQGDFMKIRRGCVSSVLPGRSPVVASLVEPQALCHGVHMAIEKEFPIALVERDALNVIQQLQNHHAYLSVLRFYLSKAGRLLDAHPRVTVCYTRCEANAEAHALALTVFRLLLDLFYFAYC
ncbi:hypothetical protein F3Y22_tig00110458pilonHSYRG00190 [Hibiscus syriacus]|uniref:AAA+ ATPase domain-containing protein n=1 Tax=Hibiscus syriacus TaxID=106335 RepID=A0A6A3ALU8_HIBSY|nr:hypothetical protein F3Y22_tig00110458pilonHSYRG00190 [Hibiscus syriacus]